MWWGVAAWAAQPVALYLQDPGERPLAACDTQMARALVGMLDEATTSIDFAIYGYRRQEAVRRALRDARDRGVKVRGVVDLDPKGSNPYAETLDLIAEFGLRTDLDTDKRDAAKEEARPTSSRCPSLPDRRGPAQCLALDLGDRCLFGTLQSIDEFDEIGGIVHHKFFVVDGRSVWTGSANVSDTCTGGYNANVAARIDHRDVAAFYEAEFAQLWEGRFHGDKARTQANKVVALPDGGSLSVWFSPQDDAMDAVREEIRRARTRIDIAAFFLTHTALVRDLLAAHARGVAVRVLLDATGASNEYSKHEVLRAAGVPVKVEDWGGKMHAKMMVVDGETLVFGSMNWTSAGERTNDENTLIVHDTALASSARTWIDRLWASVDERWLAGRPDPESADSRGSCADGSDNDFDGLRDADDPGCGPTPPALPPADALTIRPKGAGQGLIRGYVDPVRGRLFAMPEAPGYDGDGASTWFCSEADARAAGFASAAAVR
jgi:phosphatidylserine/phosphatidylglycerophosphate/cardiolipin synthase-like enzyme